MPKKNIQTLLEWCDSNQDPINPNKNFQVWLWVDVKTRQDVIERYTRSTDFTDYEEPIRSAIQQHLTQNLIEIHDIRELFTRWVGKTNEQYIRYEIEKIRANYGSSSDILRYLILYVYGGAYFDSDIKRGAVPLVESTIPFGLEQQQHRIYIDTDSQGQNEIGNDAIICTEGHPLIGSILERAVLNYKPEHPETSFTRRGFGGAVQAYYYDDPDYIESSTLFKTGNVCVREIVYYHLHEEELKEHSKHPEFLIPAHRTPEKEDGIVVPLEQTLRQPEQNHRNWINKTLRRFPNIQEAMQAAVKDMYFEITIMGFLRLDNYIDSILDLFKDSQPPVQANDLIRNLLDALEKPIRQVLPSIPHPIIQFTGRYFSQTREFYVRNHLKVPDIFFNPGNNPCCDQISFCYATNQSIINTLIRKLTGEKEDESTVNTIRKSINSGLEFILEAINQCLLIRKTGTTIDIKEMTAYLESIKLTLDLYKVSLEKIGENHLLKLKLMRTNEQFEKLKYHFEQPVLSDQPKPH